MGHQDRTADQIIATLAGARHGVVTRRQLLSAGLTSAAIRRRLQSGALIAVHRGVYRVGHRAPSVEADYLAAVLACGDGALLCGRAAGHLLGMLGGSPPAPEVLTLSERRVTGVATRRTRQIDPRDRGVWRCVPVSTPARTLVDLAAVLGAAQLARAFHEAGVRHRTTPAQVEMVLSRRPNSRGAALLCRVLRGDERVTLSTLERRFLTLLARHRLPSPQTNCPVGSRRVDCFWAAHGLVVELDGYRFHSSRHAWELDRRREREARALGHEYRRYSFADVLEDPRLMLAELRALFAISCPALVSPDDT